jgi:transcriptional regulator with XRE-family HTH domain
VEGDLQRTVGDNLKAYRNACGLSQEAFADVFGWGRTYMGKLERGRCNLTLRSLERLASRIGVDPVALLREDAPS